MKTKILILICLAVLVAAGSFVYQHIYQNQVILLKDNQAVITKESWVVGDSIFYRTEDDTHSINMDLVADVKQRGIFNKGYGIVVILKHHLTPWKHKSLELVSQAPIEKRELKKQAPVMGVVIIGILFCIAIYFLSKKLAGVIKKRKIRVDDSKNPANNERVYEGQEQIAQFFLSVFKAQKGVEPSAEATFRPVDSRRPDSNYIYELRVKCDGDWATRRMTVGLIGRDSGSRSTCYYVIYDDHMVIKISPTPLTDFDKYIQSINRDNRIAKKLSPRECLVPRVSVILKKIHPLQEGSKLPIELMEEKYIQLLEGNTAFQNYLRIGDGFAYFMDLSRYFFLGHILHRTHNIEEKVISEILYHPTLLWNPVDFEDRYGSQHTDICDRLNPVYTSFYNRCYDLLQQHHIDGTVSEFNIKEWFLGYLAGRKLSATDFDTKPYVASEINATILKLFIDKRQPVQNYQRMVHAFVITKNLKRNNSKISSMTINLLNLLSWLNEKKLAMRDLKPDNLLIAGNPSKFPQFLESANMYSIGLIDIETTVSYDTSEKNAIRQPPLGGTPSYATPTHQLKNNTIRNVYKDLPLILHLQDWYATLGMIYQTVTGERLFEKTARNLLNLKKTIRQHSRENGNPKAVLKDASHSFWKMAMAEFSMKTQKNEKKLKFISLIVSQESTAMLLDTFANTHQRISESIHNLILSQTAFTGDKTQKNLYRARPLKIHHFKIKFKEGKGKQLPPDKRDVALKVLDDLVFMKRQSEQLILTSNLLKKSVSIVSTFDLLKAMFIVVLVHMHQNCWGVVSSDS
jgi:serine/threonine protein kinase